MQHIDKLDLVELAADGQSSDLDHILAVTETFIEVGDTFFIGKHPAPVPGKGDTSSKYKVDAVIDVVEVSFLNYRIRASKVE